MKGIMKKATVITAVITMALTAVGVLAMSQPAEEVSAAANTAKVADVDYTKKGIVDVEFQEDVKYKKAKVTVKDNKGKKYAAKVTHKDSDDIEFKIKKFKKGRTYKFTVKGVKEAQAASYAKATGKVVIPKKAVSKSQRIGKTEAKDIALKDAGLTASQVKYLHVQFDYDDGRAVYEVDFVADGKEYEYDIAAKTGQIVGKDIEGAFDDYDDFDDYYDDYYDEYEDYYDYEDDYYEEPASKKDLITKTKAKNIALKHAKLSAKDVKYMNIELDYDDGYYIYEISFMKGRMEYEYDINAKTGKILSYDREYD